MNECKEYLDTSQLSAASSRLLSLIAQSYASCFEGKLLVAFTQSRHARGAYGKAQAAIHLKILLHHRRFLLLDDAHHIVHHGVFKIDIEREVYGLLHYLSHVERLGSSSLVGHDKSTRAQLDAAKVSHHHDEYVCQFATIDCPQYGSSCCARGFSVIIGAEVGALMPQHIGIAHVSSIEVALLAHGQMLLDLVKRGHGEGHSNELTTLLSKHALAWGCYSLIGIHVCIWF